PRNGPRPPRPKAGRSRVMETFSVAQRAFAEAIGTALLVFVGAGSVPAILLLEGGTKAPFSGADLGFISMAFGLIVIALINTVGPITNSSLNPARAIGPLFVTTIHGGVHNWTQQLLAYIPGNLIGAALACLAYDWMSVARKVTLPIKAAVTEPDRAEL